MAKKKKIRVAFRKNRQNKPPRKNFNTGRQDPQLDLADLPAAERVSGKGNLTRRRTIVSREDDDHAGSLVRAVDEAKCLRGRVISPHGGECLVQAESGARYECTVRRVMKSLANNERNAIVAGDRVLFKPVGDDQGLIERIEPRRQTLSRRVRNHRQVLVANVDQVLIVASAADPPLKTSLIDRYLISAAFGEIRPIICINKADLVDQVELQSVVGLYSQLGYQTLVTSTHLGIGLEDLRRALCGCETALAGQSGVGKSSLINAVEPRLNLKTYEVSGETGKGRHTTTNARLLELSFGGWVVDTPGIRQLELCDVVPAEVEGFFLEFHPFVRRCRFPDCSHLHESACGVKRAVVEGYISAIRYESYCKIRSDEE